MVETSKDTYRATVKGLHTSDAGASVRELVSPESLTGTVEDLDGNGNVIARAIYHEIGGGLVAEYFISKGE